MNDCLAALSRALVISLHVDDVKWTWNALEGACEYSPLVLVWIGAILKRFVG